MAQPITLEGIQQELRPDAYAGDLVGRMQDQIEFVNNEMNAIRRRYERSARIRRYISIVDGVLVAVTIAVAVWACCKLWGQSHVRGKLLAQLDDLRTMETQQKAEIASLLELTGLTEAAIRQGGTSAQAESRGESDGAG